MFYLGYLRSDRPRPATEELGDRRIAAAADGGLLTSEEATPVESEVR